MVGFNLGVNAPGTATMTAVFGRQAPQRASSRTPRPAAMSARASLTLRKNRGS